MNVSWKRRANSEVGASGAGLLGDAVQDHHPLQGLQEPAGLRHEESGGEVVARAKMPNNFVRIGCQLIWFYFLCFQANFNIFLHYVGFYLGLGLVIDYIRKNMAAQ